MPIIVFASPKGGVGTSTAAVLLATELAGLGAAVTTVDADSNKPLSQWAKRAGCPPSLTVISDVAEESVIDVVETASRKSPFVIVDPRAGGLARTGTAPEYPIHSPRNSSHRSIRSACNRASANVSVASAGLVFEVVFFN
jgi:hypothetical protein